MERHGPDGTVTPEPSVTKGGSFREVPHRPVPLGPRQITDKKVALRLQERSTGAEGGCEVTLIER